MAPDSPSHNMFTSGPLGTVFAKTALPIIFVMSMNGMVTVVDAIFLGIFVGPEALGAVTLMFPLYMLIIALSALVANGMSSIVARHLGARRLDDAQAVFAGAHGLAIIIGVVLILLFLLVGRPLTLLIAGGQQELAGMGHTYLGIIIFFSPLFFVLSVNSDALRNEGRVGVMAAMNLLISLANVGFNYLLIVLMGLGVAGSAYGTVLAQALALGLIIVFRLRVGTLLRPDALLRHSLVAHWWRIAALGAPRSLGFVGIALTSAAVIFAIQFVASGSYQVTVAAYGIVTRIMTFAFLPLLGISHALQSITGNNYGAALWHRSDGSLRLGMVIALVYCLLVEIALVGFAHPLGALFVDDTMVAGEVARIMPVMTAMFFASGPLMMITTYFQAIGDAGRAAILGLSKPYLFSIPLIFLLPAMMGEQGIWLAGPSAEILLFILTIIVLTLTARSKNLSWGLFMTGRESPQ